MRKEPKKPRLITFREQFKRQEAKRDENSKFFSISFDNLEEQFYWLDSISDSQGAEACTTFLKLVGVDLTKEENDFLVFLYSTHLAKRIAKVSMSDKAEKNDYESLTKLSQAKKELEGLIKNEVDKHDREFLYGFFAKTFYVIAVQRSELAIQQLVSLGRTWVKDIKNVMARYKKQDTLFVKELLNLLQIPGQEPTTLATLKYSVKKDHGYNPIFVDVENELDTSKLHYDSEKYTFLPNPVYDRIFISDLHDSHYIHGERMSMHEYYEKNIESLSPNTLKSKDLLDQVFVVYTIKKAQNGDDKAYSKLFECYVKNAEENAIKIIDRKFVGMGLTRSRYEDFNDDEIRSVARGVLTYLIKGDDPTKLFGLLEKSELDPQTKLTKRLHKKVIEGYNRLLEQLAIMTSFLMEKRKVFMKKIKTDMHRFRHSGGKSKNYYAYRLKLSSTNYLREFSTQAWSATISLDPYGALIYSPDFNKGLYKPVKNSNFTSWLFGNRETGWGGVFAHRILDWYRSKCHQKTTDDGKKIWVPRNDPSVSVSGTHREWNDSFLDQEDYLPEEDFSDIFE